MNIKVEIQRNPAIRGYDIWVTSEAKDGSLGLAKPILFEFEEIKEGVWSHPTFQLSARDADEFLSSFATALSRSGFKSDELKNTENQISAIKYHLEDMRSLVFNAGRKSKS